VAPATAAVSSTPGQLAPAAVAAPSSTETKGPPAAPAEASAKATPQQPAAAPHPVEVSYAIPLAVRVGSFAVKENAEGLTQSLKDLGYRPVMSRWSDSRGRAWYVVKLGPYARWNAASRVAARVSIAENVRPVIGPMQ
jgi:cell division septation protein DedD